LLPLAAPAAEPAVASLAAADLLELAGRFAEFNDELPEPAKLGLRRLAAFEENARFAYAMGDLAASGDRPTGVRRLIFVKPATFVVDDQLAGELPGRWLLAAATAPVIDGRVATLGEGDGRIVCRALLPAGAAVRGAGQARGDTARNRQAVEVTGGARFVVMIHVGKGDPDRAEVAERDGAVELKLRSGARLCELMLAAGPYEGAIAVTEGEKKLLPERPLPAGILPHGPGGVAMVERWDRAYRGERSAPWDSGRPNTGLVEAVESGTVKPGRVVELGCGSGTNAIYLASKGFDVTALDVAPTALAIARRKAARAGVTVRWLLADVLAPPELEPFDFIFDSGCYHGVRRGNAAGYVKTASVLSRPGTLMLIHAGNANEPRHYGPPRVEETELIGDFAATWDFVHLREVRPGGDPGRASGAWFWSVLLRRRPQ
jgi:SAM-dependent methyltransferase